MHKGPHPASSNPRGPGDCLHDAIFYWTGEIPNDDCPCLDYIRRMNRWGPRKCRQRIRVIVGWLRNEAKKRKWVLRFGVAVPGVRFAIRRLVKNAIKESEREIQQFEENKSETQVSQGNAN
jgi:hypothetical protein